MDTEKIVLVAVVLAVFAGVFFVATTVTPKEQVVDGVRVIGDKPLESMSSILANDRILIQFDLVQGNSSKNSAVTVMGAQIASNLRNYNKSVEVYGVVEGKPEVNCNANTSNCSGASIRVSVGDCNCLKIEQNLVSVIGDEDFLKDFKKIRVIEGLIGMAASRK